MAILPGPIRTLEHHTRIPRGRTQGARNWAPAYPSRFDRGPKLKLVRRNDPERLCVAVLKMLHLLLPARGFHGVDVPPLVLRPPLAWPSTPRAARTAASLRPLVSASAIARLFGLPAPPPPAAHIPDAAFSCFWARAAGDVSAASLARTVQGRERVCVCASLDGRAGTDRGPGKGAAGIRERAVEEPRRCRDPRGPAVRSACGCPLAARARAAPATRRSQGPRSRGGSRAGRHLQAPRGVRPGSARMLETSTVPGALLQVGSSSLGNNTSFVPLAHELALDLSPRWRPCATCWSWARARYRLWCCRGRSVSGAPDLRCRSGRAPGSQTRAPSGDGSSWRCAARRGSEAQRAPVLARAHAASDTHVRAHTAGWKRQVPDAHHRLRKLQRLPVSRMGERNVVCRVTR